MTEAFSSEVRLSINSREAISVMKCAPPFLTQVSVRFKAPSCTFGFLCPIRRFSARMASLGGTVLERMTSDISRFSGMSSRLDEVARSICSSSALLDDDANQPAMALGDAAFGGVVGGVAGLR